MRAFWIDRDYDRDHASNGFSRYAAYLQQHLECFEDQVHGIPNSGLGRLTQAAGPYAAAAWTVASPPIMAPGLIRWHRSVRTARASYDYVEDAVTVSILVERHSPNLLSNWQGDSWDLTVEESGQANSTLEDDQCTVIRCRVPSGNLHVPDWVPGEMCPVFEDAWAAIEDLVDKVESRVSTLLMNLARGRTLA